MPYSRLRLRLAGWFALGLLLGLAALDVSLFALLRRRADRHLDVQLLGAAQGLAGAVGREAAEVPPLTLAQAVRDALDEWPEDATALLVYAPGGELLGQRGDPRLLRAVTAHPSLPAPGVPVELTIDDAGSARVATSPGEADGGFTAVAILSTAPLAEDLDTLAWWLGLSVPLVLLVSLPAGYLLARRALAPFQSLARELEAISPQDLDRRLPVAAPPDELDRLAEQVNGLLDRLVASREQTRRFLAQAAHQLRTPLTLIRGESDLAIERPRDAGEYRTALDRISRASAQMSRRVDELFLLARAEAGEQVARTEVVELDAVALEAVDLMRGRAQAFGHRLELGEVDGLEVRGDEGLLREAALELLENACRYGQPVAPIRVAVRRQDGAALLEVFSEGAEPPPASDGSGLGLTIVRWIAGAHRGTLEMSRRGRSHRFAIVLPLSPGGSAPG